MNYQKIYNDLINRAKNRTIDGYTESHHIIPKCMGGSNHKDNLVDLTASEHYIAHQLLIKIYPEHPGLIYAVLFFTREYNDNRMNNKLYGWLREKVAESTSKRLKNIPLTAEHKNKIKQTMKGKHAGDKNPMYGKTSPFKGKKWSKEDKEIIGKHSLGRRWSEESKKKYSEKRTGGKNIVPRASCIKCHKECGTNNLNRHYSVCL